MCISMECLRIPTHTHIGSGDVRKRYYIAKLLRRTKVELGFEHLRKDTYIFWLQGLARGGPARGEIELLHGLIVREDQRLAGDPFVDPTFKSVAFLGPENRRIRLSAIRVCWVVQVSAESGLWRFIASSSVSLSILPAPPALEWPTTQPAPLSQSTPHLTRPFRVGPPPSIRQRRQPCRS